MTRRLLTIVKYLYRGISWGCVFFLFFCLFGYLYAGEAFLQPIMLDFARQVLGSVLVGIACGSTAIVYTSERLPFVIQVLIHFVVGLGVFFPTAVYLGWIPYAPENPLATILQFLLACAIFAAIWGCFYLYNRHEARVINRRLRDMDQEPPQ